MSREYVRWVFFVTRNVSVQESVQDGGTKGLAMVFSSSTSFMQPVIPTMMTVL